MIKLTKYFLFFILLIFAFFSCSKNEKKNVNPKYIVAIVGEDTIFVNDIIRRSEYTVRPPYCDDDKILDKRIILNSLIAEILFSMEAEKKNVLENNPIYNARIQGIKEQQMREKLIQIDVVDKIKIPQAEIDQAYINSKKIIQTEAVFIPKAFNANVMYHAAHNGFELSQLSELFPGVSKVVKKSLKWSEMDEEAQKAIFADSVKKGTILKPLPAEDGYRMIKIVGWVEEVEMSPGNINQQKETVKSKLKDFYIQNNYAEYAKGIMSGKRIDYFKDGWDILVEIIKPLYIDSENTNTKLNNKELLAGNTSTYLMNIDGAKWTIGELIEAIKIHPLEISDRNLNEQTFPHKLQAAIASLITDISLNDIAYDRGYDKSYDVNRAVKQWDRSYKAVYQRDRILKENNYKDTLTINYFRAFEKYLNPYFETLKQKYDPMIMYNPEVLADIKLTNLPTITYKEKGPYKEVVPQFPLITNSNKTNYKHVRKNDPN